MFDDNNNNTTNLYNKLTTQKIIINNYYLTTTQHNTQLNKYTTTTTEDVYEVITFFDHSLSFHTFARSRFSAEKHNLPKKIVKTAPKTNANLVAHSTVKAIQK